MLKQQSEIKDFVSCEDNPIWDSLAIKRRHDKILNFAIDRWSLKK